MRTLKKKISLNSKITRLKTPLTEDDNKLLDELEKIDANFERRFLMGVIADTGFCGWAAENFPIRYIQAEVAQKVASWSYQYFDEYQKAPNADIESIYFEHLKAGKISKDSGEELEQDILPKLSDEYEKEGLDFAYLKQQAIRQKAKRINAYKIEMAQQAQQMNDIEEASKLLGTPAQTSKSIHTHIQTLTEMENEDIPLPKTLLRPWLREGETTLLYSKPGVGKSLLAMLLSYVQSCEHYDEQACEIGPWQVQHPTGTLYIDGELGKAEVLERYQGFKWLGQQIPKYETKILVRGQIERATEQPFVLSKRENQQAVLTFLKKHPDIKLVIIDSVSTLFDLENENDNSEWNNKLNPFIRSLRSLGVAHIIQHHAGKNGDLRGASTISAMASNTLKLTDHKNKTSGEAWFKIDNGDKQRAAGKLFDPFYLRFYQAGDHTKFEITDGGQSASTGLHETQLIILQGLDAGALNKEIAEQTETSSANISARKKTMQHKGLITADDQLTDYGQTILDNLEENIFLTVDRYK